MKMKDAFKRILESVGDEPGAMVFMSFGTWMEATEHGLPLVPQVCSNSNHTVKNCDCSKRALDLGHGVVIIPCHCIDPGIALMVTTGMRYLYFGSHADPIEHITV